MKKHVIYFLLIITSPLTSCVSNRLSNSSVKPADIREVAYFDPLSFISLIEKGNRAMPSDSLSYMAKMALDSVIQNSSPFKISNKLEVSDYITGKRITNELVNLVQHIIKHYGLKVHSLKTRLKVWPPSVLYYEISVITSMGISVVL